MAVGAAAGGLHRVGRRSGVSDGEVGIALAGDDLVPAPSWSSTRAITIAAPPDAVWPWIVQMGFPKFRAGWYTPYWLDRLMWKIEWRSRDEIVPELQALAVGDRVPDSPDWSAYFDVVEVDPPHALVLFSTRHVLPPYRDLRFSWAFVLRTAGPSATRLFIRARTSFEPVWPPPLVGAFMELAMGPGDWVNASAMLRGIKRRAQGPAGG